MIASPLCCLSLFLAHCLLDAPFTLQNDVSRILYGIRHADNTPYSAAFVQRPGYLCLEGHPSMPGRIELNFQEEVVKWFGLLKSQCLNLNH